MSHTPSAIQYTCLVTCPFGLSSSLTSELKFLGFTPQNTFPTWTYVATDMEGIYRINLRSRIANKLYAQLATWSTKTFEDLFQLTTQVDWQQYIPPGVGVRVRALYDQDARLHSERALQSVTHKAILQGVDTTQPSIDGPVHEVLVVAHGPTTALYINTSGDALHQRGRRKETWPAPLKENIAAAMILMASRKFGAPLWDPCCGSWTLLIEAAMIARNIAPGRHRDFAFFDRQAFEQDARQRHLDDAQKRMFADRTYQIYGTDHHEKMLAIAQKNAHSAGVADTIRRDAYDITSSSPSPVAWWPWWIVTNPPYDQRLRVHNKIDLYGALVRYYEQWRKGVVLLPEDDETHHLWSTAKRKEIKNGNIRCKVYRYS